MCMKHLLVLVVYVLSGFDVDLLTDIVYDFLGIGSGEVVAAVYVILFLFFVIQLDDGIAFRHEKDQKILASIDRNGWVTLIQLSSDIFAEQFDRSLLRKNQLQDRFEHCTFAGSVLADQADGASLVNLERYERARWSLVARSFREIS